MGLTVTVKKNNYRMECGCVYDFLHLQCLDCWPIGCVCQFEKHPPVGVVAINFDSSVKQLML